MLMSMVPKRPKQMRASQADGRARRAARNMTEACRYRLDKRNQLISSKPEAKLLHAESQSRSDRGAARGRGAWQLLGRRAAAQPHPAGDQPADKAARGAARRAPGRARRQARL